MLTIVFNTWREGLGPEAVSEALARRMSWSYPAGAEVAAEYWTAGNDRHNPAVIIVFESITAEAMVQLTLEWGDVFDIKPVPSVTAADGLEAGTRIMQRLGASS
jgi:hypothetical protein